MNKNPTKKRSARQKAAERGQTVYLGSACVRCGGRRRYLQSGGCVPCQQGRNRDVRKRLRDALQGEKP